MSTSPQRAVGEGDETDARSSPDADPPEPEDPDDPAERTRTAAPPTCELPPAAGPPCAEVHVTVMPGAHLPAGLEDWLVERLRAALAEIDPAPTRVSVLIVDDATMTDLHRRHLGVDDTTDVLTFLSAGGPGEIDVATCIDEARRQAAHRGHPLEHELLLYALHGVLHGSGFDDRDEAGSAAMHAEEDRILRAIGVGPVFAGGPVARAPHRQGRSGG